MNLSSGTEPQKYGILSLGHRAVGKTVFLAGSYAQLHFEQQKNHPGLLWFDCIDHKTQANLDGILDYVAETGQYPPPTMKITSFDFQLQYQTETGTKTLCYFRWWDIPGEECQIEHPQFQKLVQESHSCCIFINAYELAEEPAYQKKLNQTIKEAQAVASIVSQQGSQYCFAIVFTQCDRFNSRQLEQLQSYLKPLYDSFDELNAQYQTFYSAIPIVTKNGTARLKPVDSAQVILWLLSQLRKSQAALPRSKSQQRTIITNKLKSSTESKTSLPAEPSSSKSSLNVALPLVAGIALLGAIAFLFFGLGLLISRPKQAPPTLPTGVQEDLQP